MPTPKPPAPMGYSPKASTCPSGSMRPLEEVLRLLALQEPQAVAAVITGELADCFSTKREGISSLTATVKRAFPCPVHFWGVSGFAWTDPLELAAANWSASAALLAREVGDCLFVDMGSTTTDLIPIKRRSACCARQTFCAWQEAIWSTWGC